MILYHVTSKVDAERILSEGFRDERGQYVTDEEWFGVWLSDRPLFAGADYAGGDPGLSVIEVALDMPTAELDPSELVTEGSPYREWLIPASVVNARSKRRIA